ncbi:MAG TPA: bacteriophage holin [bacterium]|nr:bacteriophage holin [bacterium]
MKLDIKALALTFGILWGLGVFVMTWWILLTGGAGGPPMLLERVYLGYHITPVGSIIGLIWAFVDGAVCGALVAWLYNKLAP